jgi:hypothetical protein
MLACKLIQAAALWLQFIHADHVEQLYELTPT